MVLYFTGTGNSRYLARRIAEGVEMPLYDLNTCIQAGIPPRYHFEALEKQQGPMRQSKLGGTDRPELLLRDRCAIYCQQNKRERSSPEVTRLLEPF